VRLQDIHPSTILAAVVIGAVLGFFVGFAVYRPPLVVALSFAAIVVSFFALWLQVLNLLYFLKKRKGQE
jgi:uncharacterized membrane protein (Fun14 family)